MTNLNPYTAAQKRKEKKKWLYIVEVKIYKL